ncbi:MAG: Nramp family divalent metal transporter [Actinomycetota bacterium]
MARVHGEEGARTSAPERDGLAHEIPSKNLPGVPYRDMPEALPLKKVLGPGVILLAASIGSGEYVLWPFITSQVGLVAMWAAIVGVFTQYFINMEIERYTLATGETAVTGFTRLWKPWALLFIVMTVVPWAWPGWATGAATSATFAFGLSEGSVVPITIAALIAIGAALTVSPVIYQTVEKIQFVLVGIILLFLGIAVFAGIEAQAWGDLVTGFSNFGRIPSGIEPAVLLGALAFAGAGGSLNLMQSNLIRDKGFGMGTYVPRIVSPFTGEEEAAPSIGSFFPQDEANLSRWNRWWRVANHEQFWTFGVIGAISIVLLSLLTYSTVFGREGVGEDFTFIQREGEVLKDVVGGWFGTFFWLAGAVILLSTNLGVLDMVGRVTADVLKVGRLRDNETWTESRIYLLVVWAEIAFGSIILLAGVDQPIVLLVIASALNGLVMFVYSTLLIQLNRGVLPRTIGLKGFRLVAMAWAVLFFGFFSIVVIIDQGAQLFE